MAYHCGEAHATLARPPNRQIAHRRLPKAPIIVTYSEKAALVAKLKGARDRKRRDTGKVEGRKRRVDRLDAEGASKLAAAVREAKRLRRASPKTGKRLSYRDIAKRLEAAGYVNERGARYNPASIKRMLAGDLM